jgi:hypothetical protein
MDNPDREEIANPSTDQIILKRSDIPLRDELCPMLINLCMLLVSFIVFFIKQHRATGFEM